VGGFASDLSEPDRLSLIHRLKTSALIRAAARMGALSGLGGPPAGGSPGESALASVTIYGECVGLMFQIVDDLLDVEQSAEHTGKNTNKDVQAGKITYPSVLGVEASRREVARLRDQAQQAIAPLGADAEPLRELCTFLTQRTR